LRAQNARGKKEETTNGWAGLFFRRGFAGHIFANATHAARFRVVEKLDEGRFASWPVMMSRSIDHCRRIVRTLAWLGVSGIVLLSVVPADERPVTGAGQSIEHFSAFGLVAAVFTIGYRFSLIRLLVMALLYCGGIELLQIPLPTRRARVSDFVIDFLGSSIAICLVAFSRGADRRPHAGSG
jgi:VanZ family protein